MSAPIPQSKETMLNARRLGAPAFGRFYAVSIPGVE